MKVAKSLDVMVMPFQIGSLHCKTPEDWASDGDEAYVRAGEVPLVGATKWMYASDTMQMTGGAKKALNGQLLVYFAYWNWGDSLDPSLKAEADINKIRYRFELFDRDKGKNSKTDSDDWLGTVTLNNLDLLNAYFSGVPIILTFQKDEADYTLTVIPPTTDQVVTHTILAKGTSFTTKTASERIAEALRDVQVAYFRDLLLEFFKFPDRPFWPFLREEVDQIAFVKQVQSVLTAAPLRLHLDVAFMPWTEMAAFWTIVAIHRPMLFVNVLQGLVFGKMSYVDSFGEVPLGTSIPPLFQKVSITSRNSSYYNDKIQVATGSAGAITRVVGQCWHQFEPKPVVISSLVWILCGGSEAILHHMTPDVTAPNPFGCLTAPTLLREFGMAVTGLNCTLWFTDKKRQPAGFFEKTKSNMILYLPGVQWNNNKPVFSYGTISWASAIPVITPKFGLEGLNELLSLGAITKSNSKYVYAASYPTYELLDPVTQEPIWFNAFVSNAIDLPKPMCVRSFQMPLEKSSATLATQVDLSRTELVDGAVQNSDVSIYPGALANQVIGTWASKFTHRPVSLCRVAHAYFGYYAMAIGSQRLTIVEEINAGEVTVSSVPVNTVVAHTYNPLFPELGGSYLETSGSEFRPDDFEPYYALVFGVE